MDFTQWPGKQKWIWRILNKHLSCSGLIYIDDKLLNKPMAVTCTYYSNEGEEVPFFPEHGFHNFLSWCCYLKYFAIDGSFHIMESIFLFVGYCGRLIFCPWWQHCWGSLVLSYNKTNCSRTYTFIVLVFFNHFCWHPLG